MSTIINATTTNGVVIQPDNSGSLVLQTNNGTTAVTVDTSQNTTLAGKLTTASSGIQFSDSSIQTAAASPYVLKNRIINGDMRIDQRNAGASVTPSGNSDYTLDRWMLRQSIASKFSIQQNASSVTPPEGFTNYLGATVVSAYSVTSSDYYDIRQFIEGFNVADLGWGTANAKTVTLSFWVRSSLTGTFGGALTNGSANRSYPFTYTISSANTWEQKSITIPGETSGTWLTTNGNGVRVTFGLGVGSNYSGTAGAWNSNNNTSATGATSVVGTNGATWYVTGVQLEVGSTATPFERRLYNQELANCQRYYQSYSNNGLDATTAGDGVVSKSMWISPQMRAAPTVTYGTATNTSNTSATTPYTSTISPTSSFILFQVNGTANVRVYIYNPTYLSSEL